MVGSRPSLDVARTGYLYLVVTHLATAALIVAFAILAGRSEVMGNARRLKHLFGGAMRQAGIIAAAGIVALEQNTARSRADDRWEIGHRVRLGWHPEHARVLR